MIELKGAYSDKTTRESKSVLVQFDGVLLHIWQKSDPFCRLLSSDVFSLQPGFGNKKRFIKLPNGGKVETEDVEAFSSILASKRYSNRFRKEWIFHRWQCILWITGGAFLAGLFIALHRVFISG